MAVTDCADAHSAPATVVADLGRSAESSSNSMNYNENPNHERTRNALRIAGFVFCTIGGVFALIGVIDFFSVFGTFKQPTLFWCLMVGVLLIGIGSWCVKAGFLGAASKYVADEVTPTVARSTKYVAREVGAALQETLAEDSTRKNERHDPAARLKQLEQLKADGLVSGEEYARKRQEILNVL